MKKNRVEILFCALSILALAGFGLVLWHDGAQAASNVVPYVYPGNVTVTGNLVVNGTSVAGVSNFMETVSLVDPIASTPNIVSDSFAGTATAIQSVTFIGCGSCLVTNSQTFAGGANDLAILSGVNNTNCGSSEVTIIGGSGNTVVPGDFAGLSFTTDGTIVGGNQNKVFGGNGFVLAGAGNWSQAVGGSVSDTYIFGIGNKGTNASNYVLTGQQQWPRLGGGEFDTGYGTNGFTATSTNLIFNAPAIMDGQNVSNRVNSVLVADTVLNQSGNWAGMMAGAHALTLPSATTNAGYSYTLTCASSGTNALKTVSNQNIDGVNGTTGTGFTNLSQWSTVTVRSDGSQWIVVSAFRN